jgi:uroporphyrin-III C-methyltransferase
MKTTYTPSITLVGAGPGDPELITVKGLNAIKRADVILYDALVNERLLDYAPIAKKIFVGKRHGFASLTQKQINELLIEQTQKHVNIVRLKGGDPFVFGRGYEEIQAAQEAGIPIRVIPGISSSISVPALAGIPVTHRGLSTQFQVLSGTLATGEINPNLQELVSYSGTSVVLMGLSKLPEIVELFKHAGKEDANIAIISNGSLPNQEARVGTISNILDILNENPIPAPAVLVFGEVVGLVEEKALTQTTHEYVFA